MIRQLTACIVLGLSFQVQAAYDLQPEPVAENTWLLQGSLDNFSPENGGNIANISFIDSPSGVILIDSGPSRAYGEALRSAIAQITDKPVIKILITHHHPDHMLGSQVFPEAKVAALASTQQLMASEGDAMAENLYRLVGDRMRGTEVVLATETLEPGTLDINGYRLQLFEMHGHSGADLVILDEQTGVLFAGDLLFYQRALATPHSPGLNVWQEEVKQLQELPWKLVIPGHGPAAADTAPFAQMLDYLDWLDNLLATSARNGLDMNEVMRADIPERFNGISLTRHELARSVSHLYADYEIRAWEKLQNP